jgi:hypothetical protein
MGQSHAQQQLLRLREEVQVIVDRVTIVTLTRHHDQKPTTGHTDQLRNRVIETTNML